VEYSQDDYCHGAFPTDLNHAAGVLSLLWAFMALSAIEEAAYRVQTVAT
jgi:hypothetical protein